MNKSKFQPTDASNYGNFLVKPCYVWYIIIMNEYYVNVLIYLCQSFNLHKLFHLMMMIFFLKIDDDGCRS